jgi:thiol-disulfide isomerase/thioredoxin
MSFAGTNIIHLENDDFKNNTLTYQNKPVVGTWIVMVQGNFCHFCTKMKPVFTNLANKYGSNKTMGKFPIFATIQSDGPQDEKKLAQRLPKLLNIDLSGVPAFLKFENGKFSAMIVGGQKENQLIEFMN